MKTLKLTIASLATASAIASATIPATAAAGIELGQLNCVVAGGTGFIFGSSKNLECRFTHANGKIAPETYRGEINKFGIDIGVTGKTVILWTVVAAEAEKYQPGALSGTYAGGSAEATFAAGLGANVLVGGSSKSIALQPISVSASSGVNVAVGFAQVKLFQ